jgi:hypothetical protein
MRDFKPWRIRLEQIRSVFGRIVSLYLPGIGEEV